MSWSATEIEALATKAARGAGAPAGQAGRFGKATVRHLQAGRDGAALAGALDALPAGPILDLPRAIDAAIGSGTSLPAELSDALLTSYLEALPFDVTREAGTGRLTVDMQSSSAPTLGRVTGYSDLISRMEALAAQTFVPDSDASRTSGAGAGLTDND